MLELLTTFQSPAGNVGTHMELAQSVVGKGTRQQVHGNYSIWGFRMPKALSCSAPSVLKMLLTNFPNPVFSLQRHLTNSDCSNSNYRNGALTVVITSFNDTTLLINPTLYLEKRNLKHQLVNLICSINMLTIHHSKRSHLRTPS